MPAGRRQSQPRKENDWRKFVLFRPSPRRRYYPGPGERVKHFSQETHPAMAKPRVQRHPVQVMVPPSLPTSLPSIDRCNLRRHRDGYRVGNRIAVSRMRRRPRHVTRSARSQTTIWFCAGSHRLSTSTVPLYLLI